MQTPEIGAERAGFRYPEWTGREKARHRLGTGTVDGLPACASAAANDAVTGTAPSHQLATMTGSATAGYRARPNVVI
jgi:hypothetical protein